MKRAYPSLFACSLLLLAGGCEFVRTEVAFPSTVATFEKNNFRVLEANVRGSSSGFWLLGFIPIVQPSAADAMAGIHRSIPLKDKSAVLVNVTQDFRLNYYFLFSLPRFVISADVIEYTQ